jgi:hypothetical protein
MKKMLAEVETEQKKSNILKKEDDDVNLIELDLIENK